jgi:hypothetical protein
MMECAAITNARLDRGVPAHRGQKYAEESDTGNGSMAEKFVVALMDFTET